MLSARISVLYRSMPSLSCHLRVTILPWMKTREPFFRYCPAISASLPKVLIRCHSVASFYSPVFLSRHFSVVAIEKFVTASPLDR